MAAKAIVGEKVGMTHIWDEKNRFIPVTVVKVTPVRVVRAKTEQSDGYQALQVTYGVRKRSRVSKPVLGQFEKSGVEPGVAIMELRGVDGLDLASGDEFGAEIFQTGDRVDVTATSKGHGFSGGMKRHNFKGQGAGHGNHKHHRAPGSIGACATPGRVFKGTRMAGQYGGGSVTTLNLEIVQADPERQLILVKGSVPGPKGGRVVIRSSVRGGK
ncbi:large subunit ribosomal protein L3 [Ferrithrix thermotolerans DSM 19514]|uniref:Large ribosomal subunit protein uL3 n=1 Tax=Ferrithrix thermotolerans DSM 19514 TaxID=1121881 RepID=A0A1M4SSA2_9ACTN|nr:50S ribosomal protein L3 [Ferrithrix thermotolerans]SHE35051.1 large subunit ribosomal protein L3 [Ferrithrix thermotolerans DSM 19514]